MSEHYRGFLIEKDGKGEWRIYEKDKDGKWFTHVMCDYSSKQRAKEIMDYEIENGYAIEGCYWNYERNK